MKNKFNCIVALCFAMAALCALAQTEIMTPVPEPTFPTPPAEASPPPAEASPPVAEQPHRIGAICNDGTESTAMGRGACSHHGGVRCWKYSDGTCTKR